jgi:lysophospholipase L1-like esterase
MLRNLILLICSLAVGFFMAEGFARLLVKAPPKVIVLDGGKAAVKPPDGDEKKQKLVATPLGARYEANTRHRIVAHPLNGRDIDFETNSLGYRGRELSEKSITRVLFLGDSITEADYVSDDETFVRQVERLSWATDRPVETVNTGVGGLAMHGELALLRETGLSTKPDMVVLGFYLNDFNEPFEFKVAKLPQWMKKSYFIWLVAKGVNFLMIEQKLRGGFSNRDLPGIQREIMNNMPPVEADDERRKFLEEASKAGMDWGNAWSPTLWQAMVPLFEHFSQLATDNGFEPVIVAFPVRAQVEAPFVEDYPQRRLAEIALRLNIPFLDLLPVFREEYQEGGEPLFYDHCHHTAAGQIIIAREILAFLRKNATIREATVPPHLTRDANAG